jgi:hypothetical protein
MRGRSPSVGRLPNQGLARTALAIVADSVIGTAMIFPVAAKAMSQSGKANHAKAKRGETPQHC